MNTLPNFKMLGSQLAIVMHDAGAANLLIGWLKSTDLPKIRVSVSGPAKFLWRTAFPEIEPEDISSLLNGVTAVVSGSGWASNLEYEAIYKARKLGVPVYTVIDHWVNYRQRFLRNNLEVLPTEVWVSDSYAKKEAEKQLPEIVSRQFVNMYLKEQVKLIKYLSEKKLNFNQQFRVLYVLEPIRQLWARGDKRPGEFQALDYFVSRLPDIGLSKLCEVRLRPHPSDRTGKYNDWISNQNLNISLAPEESIAEAIAWSNIIVGCESFALIIGLEAGRKVISTLPPWAHKIRLPHKEILKLSEI
jgi:hypothetical protein